jgi:RNA polymerase sigma factor (sigma-70 family)
MNSIVDRDLEQDYGAMVKYIARRFNIDNPRFDFDDLCAEGSMAVVKAVQCRPLDSQFKESTWVYNAIEMGIKGFVRKNRYDLHVSENKQKQSWKDDNCVSLNVEATAVRLDKISGNSQSGPVDMYDIIASGEPPPDEKMARAETIEIIDTEINALPEREQKVLRAWFFDENTLKNIATDLGVTVQRAAQIKDRAFKRLKENITKNYGESLL